MNGFRLALALTLTPFLVSACSEDKPAPSASSEPGAKATRPATTVSPVRFKVDGVKLPKLAEIPKTLLAVPGLPPVEDWKTLIVRDQEGREFLGARPILLTGSRTMRLVKTEAGYDFQVWQAEEGKPGYVRHRLADVRIIEVQSKSYQPPQPSSTKSLTIERDGQRQPLTEAELRKMPTAKSAQKEESQGKTREVWHLVDLIGGSDRAVILTSAESSLNLSQSELASKDTEHLIKRNRRGEFHYRALVGQERKAELRGVREIQVLGALP